MKFPRAFLTLLLFSAMVVLAQAAHATEKDTMLKARQLYAAGQFQKAIETYNQIPRGSDRWLEAVEEKGWAYHRMGDFEKSLSQTKTLLDGPFVSVVGAEPFFLQALSQLKICDYKDVLETNQRFKETQRERIVAIQNLAKTGHTPVLNDLIANANHFPLRIEEVGKQAKSLPRLFYRDIIVQNALQDIKQNRGQNARVRLEKRLQQLARIENGENFKMLQKLNLIEVETIERVHADMHADPNSYKKGQFAAVDADTLVFPDDGNPWMDELDKYQTAVNSCPRNVRRKM